MDDFKWVGIEKIKAVLDSIFFVSHHSERDLLLIKLIWRTGCRVTEALELRRDRIGIDSVTLKNLKQRTTIVENGKKKRILDPSATKEIEVSREFCQSLRNYCSDNNIYGGNYVFTGNTNRRKRLSAWYVWWVLDRASRHAGVEVFGKKNPKTQGRYKGIYPHVLRHSNAMYLMELTDDITVAQQQLGHANLNTTKIYASAPKSKIKKVVRDASW